MIKQQTLEYNLRQLTLMESRVKFYKDKEISIKKFLDDIDALISYIQNPPSEWIKGLAKLLWEIEIIYSWSLDQKKDLTDEEYKQISYFVSEIETLIIGYKKNYLSQVEDKI